MDLELLENLTNAFGPSGHEMEVQKLTKEYGHPFADEVIIDGIGSVILKKGNKGPKIMIAGHGDEIGFVISDIEDSGFLKIHNIGGWWSGNIISHQILIQPFSGGEKILGIIVNKPPHLLQPEERNKLIPLDQLYVDIGCKSKKEVETLGIRVGDAAVPYSTFRTLERTHITKENGEEKSRNTTLAVAKAFDNRIGVFIALQALKRLKEENIDHPNTCYFVSTVQEEVGLRGARTSSNLIKPDIGLALDVDISGDIPGVTLNQKMGNGVAISAGDSSMIPNPKFRKFAVEIAEKNNINWQPAFLRAGGTDAGAIHLSGIGAPSLFIGIPTRHIHSHHGMLDLDDVENAINLIVELIKKLDESTIKSFTSL